MASNKKAPITKKIILISIAIFLADASHSTVIPIFPGYAQEIGASLSTLGSYGSISAIAMLLLSIPLGRLSDRFGRKRMILIGMFIYTFGTFLCYLAQDIIQLIVFRAIQGAGAYSSILQAMIGDHFRKENKHGKGMSLFSVSMTCGYFGGIIIGGYISNFLGFRTIFLFSTGLGIISALLFITLVKEPKNSELNGNNEKQDFKLFKKDEIMVKAILE